MELILTDEQKMLQESATTFVERNAGPSQARTRRDAGGALDRETWSQIAEAGWLAILSPEDAGGLGLGMTDLAIVLEQAGKGLAAAPICAAAISAQAIAESDSAALRDEVLPAIIGGERIVVPALQESAVALDTDDVETRAETADGGFVLNGAKTFIPDATDADGYLVSASGPDGMILAYVPKDAAGMTVDMRRTVDGGGLSQLSLSGVAVPSDYVVAGANQAPALVARLRDAMLTGLGAELLGVMEQALDIALEYIRVREQFDRPIGSFQALQHRSVNDYVDVELTRSLLFQVCAAFDEGRGTPEMAAALKAKATSAALKVTKSAIQMHGGIGFTDEHDIGFYLKRVMTLAAQYGNEAIHRRRFAEMLGAEPAG